MSYLDFLRKPDGSSLRNSHYFSGKREFWSLDRQNIPKKAGVYILIAQGTEFLYPKGKSPIYYIGQ